MDIEARIFYVKSHMYQFGVAEPPAETAHPNRMAVLPCGWSDLLLSSCKNIVNALNVGKEHKATCREGRRQKHRKRNKYIVEDDIRRSQE